MPVSNKFKKASSVTDDLKGCHMSVDTTGDKHECAPYTGCSDHDLEGSTSTINDGESS